MRTISRDLLEQAKHLAQLDRGRPQQANVRRAVSAAYYSLFHFVINEACDQLAGVTNAASRQVMSRGFEHGKMKAACLEFVKHTPTKILQGPWKRYQLPTSDLSTLCQAFGSLQDLRHAADYDFSASFTRQHALDAIGVAEQAMAAWQRVLSQTPKLAHFFATVLLTWPLIEKR
jgi:uncharacterized protein (UPF0332 family)